MKYAIIEGGLVTNLVLSDDPSFAEAQGWVSAVDGVALGQEYANGGFVIPAPTPKTDEELAAEVREERNRRLETEIDPIVMNLLRWGELSTTEQDALGVYRQELLDVPQQVGFPTTYAWPDKPQ